jgi:hypothetical protein
MMTTTQSTTQPTPTRNPLTATDFNDVAESVDTLSTHLRNRIAQGGPFHAINDGLVDELVLLADDLLTLATFMTNEAFSHVLDRVAALPGGSGQPIRFR